MLGFSEQLRLQSLKDLHTRYAALIDYANEAVFQSAVSSPGKAEKELRPNFEKYIVAFDSILVVSREIDDIHNIGHFIFAVLTMMERAFENQFPLRGCVGFGDFLDDPDRAIFLSPELPTLHRAEKAQQWTGAYLTPAASEIVMPAMFGRVAPSTRNSPLVAYTVPISEGRQDKRWCLNWSCFVDEPILQERIRGLEEDKLKNTRAFLEYLENLPDDSQYMRAPEGPVTKAKIMAARTGARIKFCDASGCGVDPPGGFSFVAVGS